MNRIFLETDNRQVDTAFYLAVSDLVSNVRPGENGDTDAPVLMAGMGYECPWVRDTAINTHHAAALLMPDVARNSLLSCLTEENGTYQISAEKQYGQNWDCVLWILGAWDYYVHSADTEFLKLAWNVTVQALSYFETRFFDSAIGLFRGPACYGDGISAYPDRYAITGDSGILSYLRATGEEMPPMFSLSTNCLYVQAYRVADWIAERLEIAPRFAERAEKLKKRVNECFWSEQLGRYRYLVDAEGGCDAAEGLGEAFAILYGIADADKIRKMIQNQPITEQGIACVYPSFARYKGADGKEFGRHSGTVWPHIQSYWADAMLRNGYPEAFAHEFFALTRNAVRDGFFSEIYHPITGMPYGGWQEENGEIVLWNSEKKQTWSATGYLHMILNNILGIGVREHSFTVQPYLPAGISSVSLSGLTIRNKPVRLKVSGHGGTVQSCKLNGNASNPNFFDTDADRFDIEIVVFEESNIKRR